MKTVERSEGHKEIIAEINTLDSLIRKGAQKEKTIGANLYNIALLYSNCSEQSKNEIKRLVKVRRGSSALTDDTKSAIRELIGIIKDQKLHGIKIDESILHR